MIIDVKEEIGLTNVIYLSFIRLLSLFVYIMDKTGTAVNKVKTLIKS